MRTVNVKLRALRHGHILHAAIACFIRRGFHQTSMQEICKEAGMSPGNLYRYFESKDALIEAIAEEDRKEKAVKFTRLSKAKNFTKGLTEMLETSLSQAADPDYEKISLEVAAEAARNAKVAALFAKNEAEAKAAMVRALQKAAARGEIDAGLDFTAIATLLITLADGAIGRMNLDPTFDPKTLAPTLQILIDRFLAPPHPASEK